MLCPSLLIKPTLINHWENWIELKTIMVVVFHFVKFCTWVILSHTEKLTKKQDYQFLPAHISNLKPLQTAQIQSLLFHCYLQLFVKKSQSMWVVLGGFSSSLNRNFSWICAFFTVFLSVISVNWHANISRVWLSLSVKIQC